MASIALARKVPASNVIPGPELGEGEESVTGGAGERIPGRLPEADSSESVRLDNQHHKG